MIGYAALAALIIAFVIADIAFTIDNPCLFHKWGNWSRYTAQTVHLLTVANQLFKNYTYAPWQERQCKRCKFTQQREVSA